MSLTDDVRRICEASAEEIFEVCILASGSAGGEAFELTFETIGNRLAIDREPARLTAWPEAVARYVQQRALLADSAVPELGGTSGRIATDAAEILESLDVGDRLVAAFSARSRLRNDALVEVFHHPPTRKDRNEIRAALDRVDRYLGALLVAKHRAERCADLRAEIAGWDGRLSVVTPELREKIARHVDGCPTCRHERSLLVGPLGGGQAALRLLNGAAAPVPTLTEATAERALRRASTRRTSSGGLAPWSDPGWIDGWPPPLPSLGAPSSDQPTTPLGPTARGVHPVPPPAPSRGGSAAVAAVAGLIILLIGSAVIWLLPESGDTGNAQAVRPTTISPSPPVDDTATPGTGPSGTPTSPGPSSSTVPPDPLPAAFQLENPVLDFGQSAARLTTRLANHGQRPSAIRSRGVPDWLTLDFVGSVAPGATTGIVASVDRRRAPPTFYRTVSLEPTESGGRGAVLVVLGGGALRPAAFRASPPTLTLGASLTGTIEVSNIGQRRSAVTVNAVDGLRVRTPSAAVAPGGSATLTVTADASVLPAGAFRRQLRIDPTAGGTGATVEVTGSIVDARSVTLTVSPSSGVVPLKITATVSTSGGDSKAGLEYTFAWGDGGSTPTANTTATHEYTAAGTYQVTVTARDATGLTTSSTAQNVDVGLAAPVPVAPGFVDEFPVSGDFPFTWKPVPGAASYVIEQQCCDPAFDGPSKTSEPIPATGTSPESHDLEALGFEADSPGLERWRVFAVAANGTKGPASEWKEYETSPGDD